MRLFIAINLSQEMRESLIDLQNDWYDSGVRGNYSPEENLHLTLAFIGALKSVRFTPFPLALEGVGAFGDLWWAGLTDSPALSALAKRVRHALATAGIPFDRKRFNPHITLLRRASVGKMPPACAAPASMTVNGFSLMRSERGGEGMIYTELGSVCAVTNQS